MRHCREVGLVDDSPAGSSPSAAAQNLAAYTVSAPNEGAFGLPGTQGVGGRTSCDRLREYFGLFQRNGAPVKLERCLQDGNGIFHLNVTAPRSLKCKTTNYKFVKITRAESAKATNRTFMADSFGDFTGRVARQALSGLNIVVMASSQEDLPGRENYEAIAVPICD